MKKIFILAALAAMTPLSMMAQDDDLYFNPKQEEKQAAAEREKMDRDIAANYSGSQRSVDEYNRNGKFISRFKKIGTDSLGNDIITFRVGRGVKPDSIYDDDAFVQKYLEKGDDYEYTRSMSRWDGYYDPWLYDYYGMGPYYWRSAYWGWRNPWRYGYYAGWYDPFYDPWYYGYAGWYGGWYDPWYYGWGGYWGPYYWGRPVYAHVVRPGRGYAGHRSWGGPSGPGNGNAGRFNGGRYNAQSGVRQNGNQFGNMTRRNVENRNASTFQRSGNNMNSGNRSFNSGSSFGGGSRGGGFSGGGSFGGGARSGGGGFTGGGHFGGGRR